MYLFNSEFIVKNEKNDALVIFSGQLEGDSEEYGFLFERLLHSDDSRPGVVIFIARSAIVPMSIDQQPNYPGRQLV